MHREIKHFKKKKNAAASGCIKNKDGTSSLFEKEDIKKRWEEYIQDLFDDDRGPELQISDNEGPSILESEVKNALHSLGTSKYEGPDGITKEELEALKEFGIEHLTSICQMIYNTGHIPEDLKKSIFVSISKKHKAGVCEDFRTVSFMSHVTKLLLKIILNRIKVQIDNEVGKEQSGFRPQSGTREGIFCMRTMTERYIAVNKEIYVCFIDHSKAFDKIHHDKLIESLQKINVDGKHITSHI